MQYYYKQPEYFQKFRCIGGDCDVNCCDCSWSIYWEKGEVDKLLSTEMSDDFKKVVQEHIIPDPSKPDGNRYILKGTDEQRCPFHNKETGLCDIQKEIGEEYLSHTCVVYPRRYFKIDNNVIRFCATSCPAVIKQLMHDKKAATFETIPLRNCNFEAIAYDPPARLEKLPYLKYRMEILELYSYIFNSKLTFDTAMLIGPIFAKKVSDSSEKDHGMSIPAMIGMIKDMCSRNDPETLASNVIANYKPRYNIAQTFMGNLSNYPTDISALCSNESLDSEKYTQGKEKFYAEIHNPNLALKNIAMNIFLDLFCNPRFKDFSFFIYFSYYIYCMSTVCLIGYAAGYIGNDIEKNFVNSVAILGRRILHCNPTEIFNSLEENRICEPEQLACLII